MASLKNYALSLLGSKAAVVMTNGGGPTTLFTTPVGKTTYITHAVVHDASATLVAGTSYTITGMGAAFSLAALTTATTGFVVVAPAVSVLRLRVAEATAVVLTTTTGSGTATATIDVFGYTV